MSDESKKVSPGGAKMVEFAGQPSFVNVPEFYVSSFTTLGQPESLTLLCAYPSPAIDDNGVMGLAQNPRVALHMPAVDAKELIVLLQQYVSAVETDRGELTSEFLESSKAL